MTFLRRFAKAIFIIINSVVAIIFLLGAYCGYFDPQRWWFFGLFTLGLPYLLLALVIFMIVWIFLKKIWMLISIITIILAWYPVQNIIPANFTSTFDKQKDTGTIRLFDWNVEHFDILEHKNHPEVKGQMLDLISTYHPDIACFQEMVGSELPVAINYIPDMMKRIGLSEYFYSYEPKWNFDAHHHFGNMIFTRYPMINKQTVKEYPFDYNSHFQYADLLIGPDTVRLFNIHLQSLRFSGSNLQYLDNPTINGDSGIQKSKNIISKLKTGFLRRSVQAKNIRREIDKSPYPVIVCGDFNDVPNSYAYSTIGKDLQNAFVQKGTWIGRTFALISPTLRIDNIFADKRFKITQFERRKERLVDHFPIIADLKFK